jgi:hypothetical protein
VIVNGKSASVQGKSLIEARCWLLLLGSGVCGQQYGSNHCPLVARTQNSVFAVFNRSFRKPDISGNWFDRDYAFFECGPGVNG